MEHEETQATVMGLVIQRLYLGKRPSPKELATNGSILKRLHRQGYGWDRLARIVEGLAIRRDRGDLEPTIQRRDPVDLRWLTSAKIVINQVSVCEDAFYAQPPTLERTERGGQVNSIADLVKGFASGKQVASGQSHHS